MELQVKTIRCVVQDLSNLRVTLRSRSTLYNVAISAIVTDSGLPASPTEVQPGTLVEVQTINSQFCSARLVPFDLSSAYHREVQLYSPSLYPTSAFVEAPDHNLVSELIATQFVACRKLSSKPDFSLWTVLAISYIEHSAQHSTKVDLLDDFRGRLQPWTERGMFESVKETLTKLLELRSKGVDVGKWMAAKCLAEDFWKAAGNFVKEVCVNFVRNVGEEVGFFGGIDTKNWEKMVDEGDLKACLAAFASAFLVKVAVFQPILENYKQKFTTKNNSPLSHQRINLYRDQQRFYIIYSPAQVQNLRLNRLSQPLKVTQSLSGSDILDKEISRLLNLFHLAEDLIYTYFTSFHDWQFSRLMEESLVSEFLELADKVNTERSDQAQVEFQRSTRVNFLLHQIRERLVRVNLICEFCKVNRPSAALSCKHKPCYECLKRYIDTNLGPGLDISQPRNALKCLSEDCHVLIPMNVISSVVGIAMADAKTSIAKQAIESANCAVCKRNYKLAAFPSVCHCKLMICALCYSDVMREDQACACGASLSDEVRSAFAQEFTEECPVCKRSQPLVSGFTRLKCQSHRVCAACLRDSFSFSVPKCPFCLRSFSIEEVRLNQFRPSINP